MSDNLLGGLLQGYQVGQQTQMQKQQYQHQLAMEAADRAIQAQTQQLQRDRFNAEQTQLGIENKYRAEELDFRTQAQKQAQDNILQDRRQQIQQGLINSRLYTPQEAKWILEYHETGEYPQELKQALARHAWRRSLNMSSDFVDPITASPLELLRRLQEGAERETPEPQSQGQRGAADPNGAATLQMWRQTVEGTPIARQEEEGDAADPNGTATWQPWMHYQEGTPNARLEPPITAGPSNRSEAMEAPHLETEYRRVQAPIVRPTSRLVTPPRTLGQANPPGGHLSAPPPRHKMRRLHRPSAGQQSLAKEPVVYRAPGAIARKGGK